jgi:hypothetical protein
MHNEAMEGVQPGAGVPMTSGAITRLLREPAGSLPAEYRQRARTRR